VSQPAYQPARTLTRRGPPAHEGDRPAPRRATPPSGRYSTCSSATRVATPPPPTST